MWSIKLRGAVFRLQIHAINTCRSSADQDKFNERRTEAYLIGKITWAWAMGARLYDMERLNKMLPLSEYNTNSSNVFSNELSQNGFPFTWKPLFEDSKDNRRKSAKRKKEKRTKSLKELSTHPPPPKDSE